jgi:hypothetical protein
MHYKLKRFYTCNNVFICVLCTDMPVFGDNYRILELYVQYAQILTYIPT